MSEQEFISRAVRCPVCQTAFSHDQAVTPQEVGRDSDYRPLYADRDPSPTQVLTCPTCRYSAYAEGFDPESELAEEEQLLLAEPSLALPRAQTEPPGDDELDGLRRFLARPELFEGLPQEGEPFGAARYVLAARCREFLDEDDLEGAVELYLKGTWCARSAREVALERRCQREVVARLRKRLDEKRVAAADRPRAIYLVAELSRRSGDFTAALNAFEELRAAVDAEDEEGQRWLERARRLEALATVQSSVNASWTDDLPEEEPGDEEAD